jgi:hypothetical protein
MNSYGACSGFESRHFRFFFLLQDALFCETIFPC